MSNRTRSAVADILDIIGSAIAVGAATNSGRKPRSCDLRVLGIDPTQFDKIGRF
jgi:hypothetical protein